MSAAKFKTGRIVSTANSLNHLAYDDILSGLLRHITGDWGEVTKDDRKENELSLEKGFRLWSAYRTAKGVKFWIITEADRSVTTVLLPGDY
jgi:hypothetical protein